jgi:predicted phosphodiesterase
MPITLPPISRRRFLTGSLAAGAALLVPQWLSAADADADPHRIALLSDTHIHQDPKSIHKTNVNPYENLSRACAEIVALDARPAAVLHGGDLANHAGNPGDYATLLQCLDPLRRAGLPIHLALGNHDERQNFWAAVPADDARQKDVNDRHALLVEAPRANFYMLDSLDGTTKTPGTIGTTQLAWLTRELDSRPNKPAIVIVHHDPHDPQAKKEKVTGLVDTAAFFDAILPRKQVKAYVFGHTHDWRYFEYRGVHCVNLPPTAWLFKEGRPRGWVDLNLKEDGATFELRSLDPKHPQHGEKFDLKWRA